MENITHQQCIKMRYNAIKTRGNHYHDTQPQNLAIYQVVFVTPQVINVKEEYLIYDWIAMVSATGGTMGLCIGLSFYNMGSSTLHWLARLIKKFRKGRRSSRDEMV